MNQVLFPTMLIPFSARGHEFVLNVKDADVVLFDLHSRIAPYEQSDIDAVIDSRKPVATFCEWDRGNMSSDVWPNPLKDQQRQIFDAIENGICRAVHFCRLLDKTKLYPPSLHPYEKPILYEEPLFSADDLFNREFDICWIANDSPTRLRIKEVLEADSRLKCNIILGAPKIPFKEWIDQHRKAKLFITASAGGYTDERKQALFSVAGMLVERTDQLVLHELTDCVNCVKFDQVPSREDLDTIVEIVNDKDFLYDVYSDGADFMKMYYTPEYIANNICEIIEKQLA